MIEERYARYLEELRTTYWDKLNDWEKKFVQEVSQCDSLTLGRKQKIKDVIDERSGAKQRPTGNQQQDIIRELKSEDERIYACRDGGGWQFYLDRVPVGDIVSVRDAKLIMIWFESALPAIEASRPEAPAEAVTGSNDPF